MWRSRTLVSGTDPDEAAERGTVATSRGMVIVGAAPTGTTARFGGGAGVWEDSPDHDTDTRDPNALDVLVGPGQDQHTVLDWQQGSPVQLPMHQLRDGG